MLTPLGAGGHRPRRRRRARRLIAVAVVLVVLVAAASTWWWFFGRGTSASPAAVGPVVTCRTPLPQSPHPLPDPAKVQVIVQNGTKTGGLAIKTADTLVTRGFDVVGIGNAPKELHAGVAEVVYGPKGYAAAVRVAAYFPGATLVADRSHVTASVVVRLGPSFTRVASPTEAQANVKNVALPTPAPICHTSHPTTSPS